MQEVLPGVQSFDVLREFEAAQGVTHRVDEAQHVPHLRDELPARCPGFLRVQVSERLVVLRAKR